MSKYKKTLYKLNSTRKRHRNSLLFRKIPFPLLNRKISTQHIKLKSNKLKLKSPKLRYEMCSKFVTRNGTQATDEDLVKCEKRKIIDYETKYPKPCKLVRKIVKQAKEDEVREKSCELINISPQIPNVYESTCTSKIETITQNTLLELKQKTSSVFNKSLDSNNNDSSIDVDTILEEADQIFNNYDYPIKTINHDNEIPYQKQLKCPEIETFPEIIPDENIENILNVKFKQKLNNEIRNCIIQKMSSNADTYLSLPEEKLKLIYTSIEKRIKNMNFYTPNEGNDFDRKYLENLIKNYQNNISYDNVLTFCVKNEIEKFIKVNPIVEQHLDKEPKSIETKNKLIWDNLTTPKLLCETNYENSSSSDLSSIESTNNNGFTPIKESKKIHVLENRLVNTPLSNLNLDFTLESNNYSATFVAKSVSTLDPVLNLNTTLEPRKLTPNIMGTPVSFECGTLNTPIPNFISKTMNKQSNTCSTSFLVTTTPHPNFYPVNNNFKKPLAKNHLITANEKQIEHLLNIKRKNLHMAAIKTTELNLHPAKNMFKKNQQNKIEANILEDSLSLDKCLFKRKYAPHTITSREHELINEHEEDIEKLLKFQREKLKNFTREVLDEPVNLKTNDYKMNKRNLF